MKTITTGTEITFVKTGDKFTLTQSEMGFDITPVRLSKNLSPEPYTYQELLDLYENGKITIEGFEPADSPLVISIITNYMHTTEISKKEVSLNEKTTELEAKNLEITNQLSQITSLEEEIRALKEENGELKSRNLELTKENTRLTTAVEALQD